MLGSKKYRILVLIALFFTAAFINLNFVKAQSSTFGYTSIGANDMYCGVGNGIVCKFTLSDADAYVSSISVYFSSMSGTPDFQAAIYSDVAGTCTNQLVLSSAQAVIAPAWNTVPVNVHLTTGAYWLGFVCNNDVHANQDDGSNAQMYYNVGGGLASTWSGSGNFAIKISLYATYTTEPPATPSPTPSPTPTPTPTPTSTPTATPSDTWHPTGGSLPEGYKIDINVTELILIIAVGAVAFIAFKGGKKK